MAELKTRKTAASVAAFVEKVSDPAQREDCRRVLELLRDATGLEPAMWGTSIVGFGTYTYHYGSGRTGEWFQMGFSPRKGTLTIYITNGIERYPRHLEKLGKHKTGRSCLYIKKLADVKEPVLRQLFEDAIRDMRAAK